MEQNKYQSELRELGPCPVCGGFVEQKNVSRTGVCQICGKEFSTYYYRENNHDFCDICYGSFAFSEITSIINTSSKNPLEILNLIMSPNDFGLRGCAHCIATPLSIILAYKNVTETNREATDILINLFKSEVVRTPISLCKEKGECGIPISCGNAIANLMPIINSKYQNSTVGKRLKSECLKAVEDIHDENMCCKMIAYREILFIADFMDRYFRVKFPMPAVFTCQFSKGNRYCIKEKCEFYRGCRTEPKRISDF